MSLNPLHCVEESVKTCEIKLRKNKPSGWSAKSLVVEEDVALEENLGNVMVDCKPYK